MRKNCTGGFPVGKPELQNTDLIGLECTVVKSACADMAGVGGIVERETKNTLMLRGRDMRARTVAKSMCTFEFKCNGEKLGNLDGKKICSRPEDRPKK